MSSHATQMSMPISSNKEMHARITRLNLPNPLLSPTLLHRPHRARQRISSPVIYPAARHQEYNLNEGREDDVVVLRGLNAVEEGVP